jgi:hypothetical protein
LPRIGFGAVVLACVVLQSVRTPGQDQSAFVRLSSQATPRVTDLSVVRQQRIDVPNPVLLSDPQRSAVLSVNLFSDVSFRAVRERIETTAHGSAWIGALEGYADSNAVFTVVENELLGHIYAPFGFFRIERQAGGHYIAQQIDLRGGTGDDVEVPRRPPASRTTSQWSTSAADDGSVIDVLVTYTRDALKNFRSDSQAKSEIDMAVAETNEALRNSGVNTRLRLVHTEAVDYNETGDSAVDLTRLRTPDDGILDTLLRLRDRHAADLVALITDRMEDACGRAYLGWPEFGAEYGFSVSARRCLGRGATFAHEIGHNLGATHDWYDTDTRGAYNYSHGYVSIAGRFQDLMATYGHCGDAKTDCARLLFYANPALRHQGRPQGISVGTGVTCKVRNLENPPCDADVAQTFAQMAPLVARYRDSGVRSTPARAH